MKSVPISPRISKLDPEPLDDLSAALSGKIVGQPEAVASIIPYVRMYQAGLAPEGRPAGVFLLLGPSGTGKTRTVEALAQVLHGSERNLVKIDCGEFQMEHEVAKLIGAPPGYLGHRETQPMLTQAKLNAAASEKCGLALVLFDEIEKAAPSLSRLLLGVLDRATLRLGDNTSVNFERALIFMTSNLGARDMMRALEPDFGFQAILPSDRGSVEKKLQSIGLAAVRRKFSPEFVNRIDMVVTYQPLAPDSLSAILDQHLAELQTHLNNRLGPRRFTVELAPESREFLLQRGTSSKYGARELKRTLLRHVTQPLAAMVAGGLVEPGCRMLVEFDAAEQALRLRKMRATQPRAAA